MCEDEKTSHLSNEYFFILNLYNLCAMSTGPLSTAHGLDTHEYCVPNGVCHPYLLCKNKYVSMFRVNIFILGKSVGICIQIYYHEH